MSKNDVAEVVAIVRLALELLDLVAERAPDVVDAWVVLGRVDPKDLDLDALLPRTAAELEASMNAGTGLPTLGVGVPTPSVKPSRGSTS